MRLAAQFQILTCTVGIVLLAVNVPAASAASFSTLIRDCTDDSVLQGHYTASELRNAIPRVPTDVEEYYYCSELFKQELDNIAGGKKGRDSDGKTGTGKKINIAVSPTQRAKIEKQIDQDVAPPRVGAPIASVDGAQIERGSGRTLASAAAPATPIALIIAAIGMLLFIGAGIGGRLGGADVLRRIVRSAPSGESPNPFD